jgi:hypothetical protein
MLPFTVTKPVTKQEISIALDARDTRLASGRELGMVIFSPFDSSKLGIAQTVSLRAQQSQNKP